MTKKIDMKKIGEEFKDLFEGTEIEQGMNEAVDSWAQEMEDRMSNKGKFADKKDYISKVWNKEFRGMPISGYDQWRLDNKIESDAIMQETMDRWNKQYPEINVPYSFFEEYFLFMVWDSVMVDGGIDDNECAIGIIINYARDKNGMKKEI